MQTIIARLFGGLGNQMFCYAYAKSLAQQNNAKLKIDTTSGFKCDITYKRTYSLKPFNIQAQSSKCKYSRLHRKLLEKLSSVLPLSLRPLIKEPNPYRFHYRYCNLLTYAPTAITDGYWQSPKYFSADTVASTLIEEFTLADNHVLQTHQLAGYISHYNSISVGIRLYEEVTFSNSPHRVLSRDYYIKAIHLIASKVPKPHFFFFCLNQQWLKENISIPYPHTFVIPADDPALDMMLMSKCKHHIISNSTYYWWAAWLSQNPDKTVICPANAFPNKDIYPHDWLAI